MVAERGRLINKIGDRIRPVIDESIRVYDKLLLILIRRLD
jgi:hypothetical protein